MIDSQASSDLRRVFFWALWLRLGLALALHLFVPEEIFAPDQITYHQLGWSLASYWAGDLATPHPTIAASGHPTGYFYIVAAIYYVFGAVALLPKFLNALVGALTVRIVYDLAWRISENADVALRAARYTAFFPSLVLWSALNIRDVWIIMLIVLVCREALVLQEKVRPRSVILLAGAIVAIVQFRSYILFPVTLPILLSFLVRQRQHMLRNTVLGMIAAVAIIYADQAAGSDRRLRTVDLEKLSELRYWHTVGAGSSFEQADISTPGKALTFLPKGLALFLLAPFPWMLGSIRQVLAVPETLFFYSLLPPMFRGMRFLLKHRLSVSLMVFLLTAGMTFGYALGEGNAGTAYRHRAQMLPFFLLFAAVGVEMRRQRLKPQPAPALTAAVGGRG